MPAATTNPVLDATNIMMSHNCGPSITGCGNSGVQACSYVEGSTSSTRRVDCGATVGANRTRNLAPGFYKIIGQACYVAADLTTVCSEKPAQPLTLN